MIWEVDFAATKRKPRPAEPIKASAIDWRIVESAQLLHWREHCIECAVPYCYTTCLLYERRSDGKCARFVEGIVPNFGYRGLLDYGAEIRFRRWGKLQAEFDNGELSPAGQRRLDRANRFALDLIINPISDLLQSFSPTRKLNGGYHYLRKSALRRHGRRSGEEPRFDEFVIEACNPTDTTYRVTVEIMQDRVRFRDMFDFAPGPNLFRIPCSKINIDPRERGSVYLLPENDAEAHLIFTWLDFVRYRKGTFPGGMDPRRTEKATSAAAEPEQPASKVKVVVWDLDNTLWNGILVEDGPEKVRARKESIDLIRALDERGIVQSIASKNDHELAWSVIETLGLEDYLLYPAIHWGPKSESLKTIADEFNVGIDTFAFIDDSPFERGEVGEHLPQVRVFAETDILTLLDRPEFDVPVTDASRKRRLSYLAEAKRKRIAQNYGDNHLEFLRGCEMKAEIFTPIAERDVARCHELIERSNQLNLSTHRYTDGEFSELLQHPNVITLATRSADRFGDYGLISFASIFLDGEIPLLKDFVQSCRVAKKKLENAWIGWLGTTLRGMGHSHLQARFIPTQRNHALKEVLDEIGFREVDSSGESVLLELDLNGRVPDDDIVHVNGDKVQLPGQST